MAMELQLVGRVRRVWPKGTFKCPSAASRVRRAVRQFTRFVCASRVTSATPRATVDGTTDPTARSVVTGSGMPTRAVREIRERRAAGADSGHATPRARPPSRAGETESVASGDDDGPESGVRSGRDVGHAKFFIR